nr:hypothetical protein [Tanacetum cinerariifolium]
MVLDLENTKTTQALEINSLKRRVKKLEKKQRSRTHKLKRLYKVGLIAGVDSSDEASLGEDASKQERIINDIDADEGITLAGENAENQGRFNDQEDANMLFDVTDDFKGEEVFVSQEVPLKEVNVAVVKVQDNDKGKMVEPKPIRKLSKNDQLMLNEEVAFKLQAEEEKKEERLAREKAQQIKEVNIAWNDIQAKINKRRKFFAAKRAVEKRNIPPIRAQKRSIMCIYLKNMEGWKLKSLKNKSFANIQELFDKAMERVNTFINYMTDLIVESLKEAKAKVMECSSKKAREDLEQENAKKQKMEDDK